MILLGCSLCGLAGIVLAVGALRSRHELPIVAAATAMFFVGYLLAGGAQTEAAAASSEPVGRWVDFGPWNGVVDCESSPTRNALPL